MSATDSGRGCRPWNIAGIHFFVARAVSVTVTAKSQSDNLAMGRFGACNDLNLIMAEIVYDSENYGVTLIAVERIATVVAHLLDDRDPSEARDYLIAVVNESALLGISERASNRLLAVANKLCWYGND